MENQTSKRRLIMLLKLLSQETDENHQLSTRDISEYFHKHNIPTDRRTIKADAELLLDMGYDVIITKGTQNRFFMASRSFELPEVRLLMDAVSASKFITPAKSEALIDKLGTLVSKPQAELLGKRIMISERIKPVNERVYYCAELIRLAIENKQKITFQYYEYTPEKKKILKHNGRIYVFSPYDLIWNEDRYYALGYSEHHDKIISFRVDRMCNVQETEEDAVPCPADYSLYAYGKKIFDMFPGTDAEITLCCENDLMRIIVDRFGDDIEIWRIDDKHFGVKTVVSVSPTFYAWVFQFCGRIRITSPEKIVNEYNALCQA